MRRGIVIATQISVVHCVLHVLHVHCTCGEGAHNTHSPLQFSMHESTCTYIHVHCV